MTQTTYPHIDRDALLHWAQSVLPHAIIHVHDIAATAYSYVLRLDTDGGIYYLKKTPPTLFIEAKILGLLRNTCGVENIPTLYAANDDLHCFIMQSCGDLALRTLFDGTFDAPLFCRGLSTYIDLQQATIKLIDKFLTLGVPDWRIQNMPHIYKDFITDEARLSAWDITPADHTRFMESTDNFKKLCDRLAELNLPDVLNHSDLHDNAMLLDQATKTINIIDLGEATIGHPLLPLSSTITNYLHRYRLETQPEKAKKIKDTIANKWGADADELDTLIPVIGPLNYALTFRELMKHTEHNFPKWRQFCKGAFFDFLDRLDTLD